MSQSLEVNESQLIRVDALPYIEYDITEGIDEVEHQIQQQDQLIDANSPASPDKQVSGHHLMMSINSASEAGDVAIIQYPLKSIAALKQQK